MTKDSTENKQMAKDNQQLKRDNDRLQQLITNTKDQASTHQNALDKVLREKQELLDKYNALRDQRGDSDDRMVSAEFKVIAL